MLWQLPASMSPVSSMSWTEKEFIKQRFEKKKNDFSLVFAACCKYDTYLLFLMKLTVIVLSLMETKPWELYQHLAAVVVTNMDCISVPFVTSYMAKTACICSLLLQSGAGKRSEGFYFLLMSNCLETGGVCYSKVKRRCGRPVALAPLMTLFKAEFHVPFSLKLNSI